MPGRCVTRALKNAKFIRSVAPNVFAAKKSPDGYASIVPLEILERIHRLKDAELHGHSVLVDAAQKARAEWEKRESAKKRTKARLFGSSSFSGTLYLVKATFAVGNTTISISDANVQTASQYLQLALPQISQYCSSYGENHLALSTKILPLNANVPSGKYDDDNLQDWVKALVQQLLISKVEKRPSRVCVVLLNPLGVTNTDGDISQGVGGYHDKVMVPWLDGITPNEEYAPFCFVNVLGSTMTVADRSDIYAESISHEVAEMIVDPYVEWPNPEVCDACAGNCGLEWRSLFQVVTPSFSRYLGSKPSVPPTSFNFDFYVAGVAHPDDVDSCPAGSWGCDYGPDDQAGLSELLFYDKAAGYGELYSVGDSGGLSLQTVHDDWRNSWSLIVPGAFTPKDQSSPLDLLFYDSTAGVGEVYRTGNLGQTNHVATNGGWRSSWSIIVPGHFSDSPNVDLLFYDPSAGHGEFYHTDGHGNLGPQFASYDDWRTTWSLIIPGKFSDSHYTDLLFYDPTSGTGEFYATGNGLRPRFAGYTDWRETWSIIVAGKFSDSPFDDLMFYDPTSGTGEFYSTGGGLKPRFAGYTNWRTSWAAIVAGKFSNSPYADLLFYDPSAGVGEIYKTGGGLGGRTAGFTDWRTTWSIIKRF